MGVLSLSIIRVWQGNNQQICHLNLLVEMTEDIIDLVLETARQHLVSLVEDKLLDVVGPEHLPADHVEDTAGGSHHNVQANFQLPHVLPEIIEIKKQYQSEDCA